VVGGDGRGPDGAGDGAAGALLGACAAAGVVGGGAGGDCGELGGIATAQLNAPDSQLSQRPDGVARET